VRRHDLLVQRRPDFERDLEESEQFPTTRRRRGKH
jgi:hypothetical protein